MSVTTRKALSTAYGLAGFVTLAVGIILLSTGVESPAGRVVVILGAAICGLLSLYYLAGGE